MPVAKGGTMIRGNDLARFMSKVKRDGDCLVWTGSVDRDGYGKFSVGPKGRQQHIRAHRWIFERSHGQLASNVLVLHRCDNPPCVELDHLSAGSQLRNVHDALERDRRPQFLTAEMVAVLRAARATGAQPLRALAHQLGIKYTTAYAAAIGQTWKHIK